MFKEISQQLFSTKKGLSKEHFNTADPFTVAMVKEGATAGHVHLPLQYNIAHVPPSIKIIAVLIFVEAGLFMITVKLCTM